MMIIKKNIKDLNYLGKYSDIYYYEQNGTVYTQISINKYERWGDLGLFQTLKTAGIIK